MSTSIQPAPEGYVYPTDKDRAKWGAMAKEAKRLGFTEMSGELLAASRKPKRFCIRCDIKATYNKFYRDLRLTP